MIFITRLQHIFFKQKKSPVSKFNEGVQKRNRPSALCRISLKSLSFVLPVTRGMNFPFLYCERQVSRLIAQTLVAFLPGLPVVQQPKLANYGDEFIQDLHLFPFSPIQTFRLIDTLRICIYFSETSLFQHRRMNSVKKGLSASAPASGKSARSAESP